MFIHQVQSDISCDDLKDMANLRAVLKELCHLPDWLV